MCTRPLVEHRDPPELLEPTEVVLALMTMWVQVGGVELLGGDPTVNITTLGFVPVVIGGVPVALPQHPVSIGRSALRLSVLP